MLRAWVLLIATIVCAMALAACASAAKGNRCPPIDPELFEEYGGMYDECTVDVRARVLFGPRIDYPYQVPNNITCVFAEIKVVVDTTGKPILQTAYVSRANDQRYVELAMAAMPQLRFAPGKVKGRAVHQISRWETRTAVGSLTASRTATTRSTSC